MPVCHAGRTASLRAPLLIFLLIATVWTPNAGAQVASTLALRGVVRDEQRAEPIAAAQVRLIEIHRTERTHDDGSFELHAVPPGRYTLAVTRLGYRPLTRIVVVSASDTAVLRIGMTPAVVQLERQVVTGTVTGREGEEVLSASTVLSDAALDRRLGATVAATLESQPGVAVSSIGGATARPVIRGLGGDRILVLEDGQRPGDMSSTSGDHAVAVEALTAKSVEVVRGPMSLLYGSSALGGVVNVVREEVPRSRPEHLHGTITSQAQSAIRGGTAGGEIQLPLGSRFAMRAEGTVRGSGDTRTPRGALRNTAALTHGAAIGLATFAGEQHAGVSYRHYSNDYGIPGGFVGSHPDGVDVKMRRHTARAEGEWHLHRAGITSLLATGLFTNYAHREIEKNGSVGTRFGQTMWSGDLLARHDSIGPVVLGAIGMRAQYRDVTTGGSLRTPATRDWTLAGFLVEELGHGSLRLQLGARYDWARYAPRRVGFIDVGDRRVATRARSFGAVSGSAGLLYTITEGIRLGASASRAYRTPDFNELYSNGPHLAANAFEVGDPSLRQETGIGLDAFVRVTRARMRAELAAFHNRLDDYITSSSRGRAIESQQGRPLFLYTNEDAVFHGAEAEVELGLSSRLVLEGTASLVRARFTNERAPIPVFTIGERSIDTSFVAASRYPSFIPPLNGRAELRYETRGAFGGVGTRVAAAQRRVGDFEEPTAGFAVAHVNAGYRMLRGRRLHVFTLRVDNVLDTEYREHLSRVKVIMPEPGRNVSLLYRLTF